MDSSFKIYSFLSKTVAEPLIIVPLLKELFETLCNIPDYELREIFKKYPKIKKCVNELKQKFA